MVSETRTPVTRGRRLGFGSLWIALVAVTLGSLHSHAQPQPDSWPQWGGPTRNFHADSVSIARSWSDAGPQELWRRPLGEGYSSIVVEGDTLVTMYRREDDEVIVALDAQTGVTRWEHAYRAPLVRDGYFDVWLNAAGPGPYATPLLADGLVFAIGVNGHLHALSLSTGTRRWSHDLVDLLRIRDYNAFAASPLSYGDTVILPMGGSERGVVAFARDTGHIVWHADDLPLAPASPLLIDVDGERQLVVLGQQEVVGLDPANGRRLWSHPHANELGLNISTPLVGSDNRLFVSSAYDGGSRMIRLSQIDGRTTTDEVWFNHRMRLHFGNALQIGDVVLGSSGDFGPAFVTALDVETGEERWRERSLARAHFVYADGVLVIVDEDGEVAVASVTDAGLNVHARKQLLTANAWTPPTVVGSVLYVRDRDDIVALALGS